VNEKSAGDLMALRNELASAAQAVYDEWDQDAEGHDEEYGGGGICHEVADAMVEVLGRHGIESQSVSQSIGEVHVYVVAKVKDGVYTVDILPGTYEKGSAYTWSKIPGVKFDANDVDISQIDADPNRFEEYLEGRVDNFKRWLALYETGCPLIIRRSWATLTGEDGGQLDRRSSRKGRRSSRR
jgi:hypothetical protein